MKTTINLDSIYNDTIKFAVLSLIFLLTLASVFAVVPDPTIRNVPGEYATIQTAIDAANPGDTIIIAAGTYDENIVIDSKTDLTIQGVGDTTLIEPSLGIGFAITDSSDITIANLKIHTTGTDSHGIWVGGTPNEYGATTGLTVQDTIIVVDGYSTGIYAEQVSSPHTGWLIGGSEHGNFITINDGEGGTGDGLDLHDVSESEVSYNEITLNDPTKSTNVLWTAELSDLSNLAFEHNTVSGSSGSEVAVLTNFIETETDYDISGVSFENNTFSNWGLRAIRVGAGNGDGIISSIEINSNTFEMTEDTEEVIGGTAASDATGTGNTFNVESPATIQKAIDAAFEGDTINVADGTYEGGIDIETSDITLQGSGFEETTVIDITEDGYGFSIFSSNITIDGFRFEGDDGTGTGVEINYEGEEALDNIIISNSGFFDLYYGVYSCCYTERITVTADVPGGTVFQDITGGAVWLEDDYAGGVFTVENTLMNNIGEDEGDGIFIYGANQVSIRNNALAGITGDGIVIGSAEDGFELTIADNNVTTEGYGIYAGKDDSVSYETINISGNIIEDNDYSGVYLSDTYFDILTFSENTISGNSEGGIYVYEVSEGAEATFSRNRIEDNGNEDGWGDGIYVEYVSGEGSTLNITDNPAISGNIGKGIYIYSIDALVTISGNNTIEDNGQAGIYVEYIEGDEELPATLTIEENTISDNGGESERTGIHLLYVESADVSINQNSITDDSKGLIVEDTDNEIDATSNWWGDTEPSDNVEGNVDYSPYCTDSSCSATEEEGQTTVDEEIEEELDLNNQTNNATDGSIVIGGEVKDIEDYTGGDLNNTNVSLETIGDVNVSIDKAVQLTTSSGATINLTNANLTGVTVSIPNGTTILASSSWDGILLPPTSGTSNGTAPSGFSVGGTVIEVGSSSSVLIFDTAVTIMLNGVTGSVGYKPAGSSQWVQITTVCGGTYDAPENPTFPGECYITDGTNTKIVTYHFTSYGNLNSNPSDSGSAGSTSGGGSNSGGTAFSYGESGEEEAPAAEEAAPAEETAPAGTTETPDTGLTGITGAVTGGAGANLATYLIVFAIIVGGLLLYMKVRKAKE
ncbi:TPA: hypothetical protein HA239_02695 [Candidatus Woesearchaeota archaeon]|nr:Cell surface glycoprotein [archaeon GW2011_AR15]HIH41297.1 hypothetical protein [Candidatus Woesearchaeota archaeon]